ncbi:FliO/MopB family protein [Roseiconus lacunae]|uniref:FliO/MopB family protein n=1 Tax=Roseiconus lacunae TaxID=2605694 RepID=UPI001E282BFC|nr:flagellar biosynthetic protein FliO [Roseiconus lacunae]MCD0458384.1 flagellar biosynthetic protein FliO [Roseiconus lacunae]
MSRSLSLSICGLLLLGLFVGPAAFAEFPEFVYPEQAGGAPDAPGDPNADGNFRPLVTTASALAIVLAIFGGLVWVSRKYGGGAKVGGTMPEDVFRVLGGASLDARTQVRFLRVGNKVLVIGQAQTGDPVTLSEIDDPDEVERITARCMGRPEIVGQRTPSVRPAMERPGPIRRSGATAG